MEYDRFALSWAFFIYVNFSQLVEMNPCETFDCQYGGSCSYAEEGGECVASCDCTPCYYGDHCEQGMCKLTWLLDIS